MKRLFAIFIWFIPTLLLAQLGKIPERTIENVSDGVVVTYIFPEPIIHENTLAPGTFFWQYAGFGINDTSGEPAIPFRIDKFVIPSGYSSNISILDVVYRDTLFVMSPSIPYSVKNNTQLEITQNTSYIGFFPSSIIEWSSVQDYRSVRLQEVTIQPVQYDYEHQIARIYSKIQYKITYLKDINYQYTIDDDSYNKQKAIKDKNMDKFLFNIALNYNVPASQSGTPCLFFNSDFSSMPNLHQYLIVTTNEYLDSIQDFIEWKRLKGNHVHVLARSKGEWSTYDIKHKVDSLFNVSAIDYILIMGGYEDVPADSFIYVIGSQTYKCVSDFSYGLPVTDLNVPQICRGRVPADTSHELAGILRKIIQYEKYPVMDENFYHTAIHCGEFSDNNRDSYEDACFVQTCENIRHHLIGNFNMNVHRVYYLDTILNTNPIVTPLRWNKISYGTGGILPLELQPNSFGWNGNGDSIKSHINEGALYVLYNGHGGKGGWWNPALNRPGVSSLQNDNKYPVVFSCACLTGKYNETDNCFAEAFLKKEDGGCVGIFAATETSLMGYDDAMALGMFDAIWPNLQPIYLFNNYASYTPFTIPTYELGRMLDLGLARMGETFGLNNQNNRRVITNKLYHCFGDPSMRIYTDTPKNFAEPLIFLRNDSIFVFRRWRLPNYILQ